MPARQSISSLRFILASRKVDSACFHEATPTFWFRSDCEGRLGIDAETLKGASRRGFRFCDPSPSSGSSGGAGPFRIQLYMSSVEGSASLEFSFLVVQPCDETKGRAAHRSGAGSEVHSGVSSIMTTMAPARKLVACLVVLALCALAPHSAEAKKKRTAIGRPGVRFLAPAPAPVSAMMRGRTLLAGACAARSLERAAGLRCCALCNTRRHR